LQALGLEEHQPSPQADRALIDDHHPR
jgi:hypothetical protein